MIKLPSRYDHDNVNKEVFKEIKNFIVEKLEYQDFEKSFVEYPQNFILVHTNKNHTHMNFYSNTIYRFLDKLGCAYTTKENKLLISHISFFDVAKSSHVTIVFDHYLIIKFTDVNKIVIYTDNEME